MTVAQLDLRCPWCGNELVFGNAEYHCDEGHAWPVVNGIPRFVGQPLGGLRKTQDVFDFEHRRYADSAYTRFSPQLVQQFLEDVKLPADFFQGKRALDAGCGSGRWTYALAELGADVTAFDLTAGGVESAHEEMQDRANVRVLQANIFELPFGPESFDFVMSWGVLHHTPDTRSAFEELVPLVRPGGTLYIMVYERYEGLRMLGTNALRFVLRRVSDERRYRFCRHLIVRDARLFGLLSKFVSVAYGGSGLDEKTIQFGLYDAYSPRYNHVHTADEVTTWFREAGFEDVVVVASGLGSVRVRGRRPSA